jgi:flagellar transcriptional activator FlhD
MASLRNAFDRTADRFVLLMESSTMNAVAYPNEQLLEEVREVNLAYLVLAQHMIRADKAQALYRLGVSEEIASVIDQLTPAQLMRIAGANQLICRFRFDDDLVWGLLTSHSKARSAGTGAVAGLHANIVMAGQITDAA